MRYLLAIALAAAGCATVQATAPGATALLAGLVQSRLATFEAATVKVLETCPDGTSGGTGSGVWLRTGLVATAGHMTADGCTLTVSGQPATVVAVNRTTDVAILLTADLTPRPTLELAPIYRGLPVFTIGWPYDFADQQVQLSVSPGFLTSVTRHGYRVSSPAYTGNSGGPVFDYDGRLVGLFVAMWAIDTPGGRIPFAGYYYVTKGSDVMALLATATQDQSAAQ